MTPSLRSRLLAVLLGSTLRPYCDHAELRGVHLLVIRGIGEAFTPVRSPFGTRRKRVRDGEVRGVWVCAKGADPDGAILYLHGGGFVFGSPRAHDNLVRRLSAASGFPAFIVNYRRAPRHPFPAAADDSFAAYRWLLDQGLDPSRIVLAGDSAGGQLVASVLNDATRDHLPMPAAALLMSPVMDGTASLATVRDQLRRDPVISPEFGRRCAAAYRGATSSLHPRLRLLDAPKTGWPPVLIQVGDTECLQADAEALEDSLNSYGVPCQRQVWAGQVHVFQAWATLLPEARTAIGQGARFLRDYVIDSAARPVLPAAGE